MITRIKRFLQHRLWDMMDFFQAHLPFVYKLIKKGIPKGLKQAILKLLTSKSPELMYENSDQERKAKGAIKITFIISRQGGQEVDLLRLFKFLLFSPKKHKEFIVISKEDVPIINKFIYRPKRVKTLQEAILKSKGDYLCFLEEGETFTNSSASKIYKIINDTKADIYFGNYINGQNELVRVHNTDLKYDFSKSVLPLGAAFGLKILSTEAAIRTRLPKGPVFEYLLEASDKTDKVVFLEKAFIKNVLVVDDQTKDVAQQQADTLSRRYYYDNTVCASSAVKSILFIAPHLVVGGAEKVFLDLVKEFSLKKIKVDIFCTHGGGEWSSKFVKAGAKVYLSKKPSSGDKVNEIFALAKKNKYDVIHTSNTEYGHFFAVKSKELPYRPLIVDTVHSQNNPLCQFTVENQASLDRVITVNKLAKETLKESIDENKICPVYNGVNVELSVKPTTPKERFDNPVITFVGRASDEKNPVQFVKVANSLLKSHPTWKFNIISGGKLLGAMKKEAEKAGTAGVIEFFGEKPNGVDYISQSSCFVMTSFTEGLPITILESLTLGVPVVTSVVGGIGEVVKSGETGFLVENPEDTDSYVKYIEDLFKNRKKYETISDKCLALSREFTSKKMAENVLKVYRTGLDSLKDKFEKVTTIAMLSYNRTEEIKKTLSTIYSNTLLPFNVLVLDNNSSQETKKFLRGFQEKHKNFRVIFEEKNLGCPGGRQKMLKLIKADYIVTIDNDMEVPKFWLRDLILRLEEDKKIVGACVKDIFPWGKVEFTGGKISKDSNGFSLFNAVNYRKNYDDLSTLDEFDCDWIPGGATIWKGNILEIAEHYPAYVNAFEDFDYSLQIRHNRYRIVNCPNVMFIHNHASGYDEKKKEKEAQYIKDRNNSEGFLVSMAVFYKRTGHLMRNDKLFELFGFSATTSNEVKKILEDKGPNVKPIE